MFHHAYLSGDLDRFKQLQAPRNHAATEPSNSFKGGSLQLSSSLQKLKLGSARATQLNQVDFEGRTVFHLAATDGNVVFARQCLLDEGLEVTKPDAESGWTALHRALYAGRVEIATHILARSTLRDGLAQKEALLAIDHEGNSAFDTYNSTVPGVSPRHYRKERGGSDLFTFGSNKNHTLCFADSDDRAFAERVSIRRAVVQGECIQKFRAHRIRDVVMQKLHTLVLTTDLTSNLYICGFANNGRLGIQGGTQFTLKPVPLPGQVIEIAAAQDHSVAVLANGDIYTWGMNRYGQLGFESETKGPDSFVTTPRKVLKLAKERVIGVAASAVHTICFTQDALFSWGLNEGQLGYEVVASEGSTVSQPRKVSAINTPVIQVTASRYATACLLATHEVVILASYGFFKLPLQLDRTSMRASTFRPRSQAPAQVVKLASSGRLFALLTNIGDIFTFPLDESWQSLRAVQLSKLIKVTKAWALRKNHLAARDFDIGQDGQLILCTESGMAFTRSFRKGKPKGDPARKDFKFTRVARTTRIIQVRASEHGAFGLLRDDVEVRPIFPDSNTLAEDLLCTLPYAEEILENGEAEDDETSTIAADETSEAGDDEDRIPDHVLNLQSLLSDPTFQDAWQIDEVDQQHIVVCLGTTSFPIPTALLCARSPACHRLVALGSNVDGLRFAERELTIQHPFCFTSFVIVMHYLFTDILLTIWAGGSYQQPQHLKTVRDDVRKLAHLLDLKSLAKAMSSSYVLPPKASLEADCLGLLAPEALLASADCKLLLKDGELLCHSFVITSRSEFFSAIFQGAWLDHRRSQSSLKVVDIDVKHISMQTMKFVLTDLYGDLGTRLFDSVEVQELDDLLEIVLSVLAAATELILPRLRESCQSVLARYIHRKNVAILLCEADALNAEELKEACLEYCTDNLQLMLENNLLGDLDSALLRELELCINRKQLEKLPVSKSGRLLSELAQRRPEVLDLSAAAQTKYLASLLLPMNQVRLEQSVVADHSPMQRRPSEQGRTSAAPSPLVEATRVTDESIFLMEDYDLTEADQGAPSTKPDDARFQIQAGRRRVESPALNTPPSMAALVKPENVAPSNVYTVQSRGWAGTVSSSPVLDLRSVMNQESPARSVTAGPSPRVADGPARVSQRDRKKAMQDTQAFSVQTPSSPNKPTASSSPWSRSTPPSNTPGRASTLKDSDGFPSLGVQATSSSAASRPAKPRQSSLAMPISQPSASAIASTGKDKFVRKASTGPGSLSPTASSALFPTSLADIIAHENVRKVKIAEYQAKRSMKEIQEQEEFERWFAQESARVQQEEEAANLRAQAKPTGKTPHGKGKAKGKIKGKAALDQQSASRGLSDVSVEPRQPTPQHGTKLKSSKQEELQATAQSLQPNAPVFRPGGL